LDEEAMIERVRSRFRRRMPWGAEGAVPPDSEIRRMLRNHDGVPFRTPRPSITVVDEQVVSFAGREWVSVHTPGHTQDHLCLLDPAEGVLLSGDHVLPTITPHIGGMTAQEDP